MWNIFKFNNKYTRTKGSKQAPCSVYSTAVSRLCTSVQLCSRVVCTIYFLLKYKWRYIETISTWTYSQSKLYSIMISCFLCCVLLVCLVMRLFGFRRIFCFHYLCRDSCFSFFYWIDYPGETDYRQTVHMFHFSLIVPVMYIV